MIFPIFVNISSFLMTPRHLGQLRSTKYGCSFGDQIFFLVFLLLTAVIVRRNVIKIVSCSSDSGPVNVGIPEIY